ncbi:hypothetical protein BMYO_1829 [Bifidobacterium myosotis]|uniref:Uncharacterized protein n=1 Tax=Bifidobacterium myosotis TaxID=1630166 RepID=A0A261FEX0_9BIFI|nr:hypothetical protein [Bifidobacterium myosotis]OZG57689.1 hypothetical protein BMYO_1829 [Bifidobacterium myosotis]
MNTTTAARTTVSDSNESDGPVNDGHEIEPISVTLIDENHLEVLWPADMVNADRIDVYHLNFRGAPMPLFVWDDSMEWQSGTLYQKEIRRTTVSPIRPMRVKDFDDITIGFSAPLAAADGRPVTGKTYHAQYHPYYTHFQRTASGILIKSGNDTSQEARDKAAEMVDILLAKLPEEAKVMTNFGVTLSVYGPHEDAFDVPEHRMGYKVAPYAVAGYGACEGNPAASIAETNVLRVLDGPITTKYRHESILAHEFAHGIHLIGLKFAHGGERYRRFGELYRRSKEAGLWPGTYAISNHEEFFATLTTIWFDVMEESPDGSWEVRGPVNTREELKRYDPEAYEFMAEIYPETHFPEPWAHGLDRFDIDGTPKDGAGK